MAKTSCVVEVSRLPGVLAAQQGVQVLDDGVEAGNVGVQGVVNGVEPGVEQAA